jgi:hypothetical protein
MARRLRVSSAGVPEHLIQRGNNRQATFACEEDMQAYVGWLKTYSKKYKVRVIKGVRVNLNELYSYLLIKRGWFNGEKTTSF